MALRGVEESLRSVAEGLEEAQGAREFLIRNTRGVVILCSQAIISVHRGDVAQAAAKARRAARDLAAQRRRARGDLRRYVAVPEQELAEALALIAVARGKEIPSAAAMRVSGEAYVLGLLDCVGELKRLVLDCIRTGRAGEAQRVFGVMEGLYELLYPFAMLDKVVKEARRKTDVCRMLVEDARAAVTEEARRAELIGAVRGLGGRAGA